MAVYNLVALNPNMCTIKDTYDSNKTLELRF